jgi:hypothetical protein
LFIEAFNVAPVAVFVLARNSPAFIFSDKSAICALKTAKNRQGSKSWLV